MFRAVVAFTRFELELFFRTLIAFFFTYLMPCAIYAVVLGAIHKDVAQTAGALLPLFVGLISVFVAFYTLATQMVINREGGFFKRVLVTNLNPVGIALSTAIRGYVLVLIGLVLMIAETVVLFHAVPQFAVAQALLSIVIGSGGIFLVALIPVCFIKRSSSMFAVSSVSSYLLAFFSGVRPPLGPAETYAHYVDFISPSYYALQVLRAGFHGELFRADVAASVCALVLLSAVSLLVVRKYFSWM